MNRRDVIFFGLAAAALGAVLFLGRRGGSSPVIGRIGSTITLGSDPGAIADAIRSATAPAAAAAPTPPAGAVQMGNQWFVRNFNGRNLIPWIPPTVASNP